MPEARKILREVYHEADPPPEAYAELVKQLQALAEDGNLEGQLRLGLTYAIQKDDVTAVKWFRSAAERGQPLAQLLFGMNLQEGRGLPKNEPEALNWIKKAAEKRTPRRRV